jgi:hypothetical protein
MPGMDEHTREPAIGSTVAGAWDHLWQRQDSGLWRCLDHDLPDLDWSTLWAQHGPLKARAVAHETGPAPQSLKTSPMVVAVTWDHEGRPQLGRVADWQLTPAGWTAFVITERGHTGGGWLPADRLQPSDHPVATTFGAWEWGTWEPPTWPAQLTRFAGAAWNDTEHARATKYRAST